MLTAWIPVGPGPAWSYNGQERALVVASHAPLPRIGQVLKARRERWISAPMETKPPCQASILVVIHLRLARGTFLVRETTVLVERSAAVS